MSPEWARRLIDALGGARNVARIEACAATRLRVVLNDDRVSESAILAAGAQGVMVLPNSTLHVIVGLGAEETVQVVRAELART